MTQEAAWIFRPANSDEGRRFETQFCDRCERDAAWRADEGNDGCPIHSRALALPITDPCYPTEWRHADDKPTCTAFVPEGQPTPEQVARDRERYEAAMAEMRAAHGQ